MPNGQDMLNDLEFEKKIADFTPGERFLARELYRVKENCQVCNTALDCHDKRISSLEDDRKKIYTIAGLIAALSAGGVSGIFKWLTGGN